MTAQNKDHVTQDLARHMPGSSRLGLVMPLHGYKNVNRIAFCALLILFHAMLFAEEPVPKFKISSSPTLHRPIILFPAADRDLNGDLPHEVVGKFLKECAVENHDAMNAYLSPNPGANPKAARRKFIDKVAGNTKSITYQEFSTRQKAGNRRVEYQLESVQGEMSQGDFYLSLFDGVYKIHTKSYWFDPNTEIPQW
jgi:hypothetical protein